MKSKFLLTLVLLLFAGNSFAQPREADAAAKRQYLVQTYGINENQADSYKAKLNVFHKKLGDLHQQTLTSTQVKKQQKDAFLAFSAEVATVFAPGQYSKWKRTTQNNERFRLLSEEMLVQRDVVVALFEAEFQWSKDRKELWDSSISVEEKHTRNQLLSANLDAKTLEILGANMGRWYLDYRNTEQRAFTDMDKYKTSYSDALRIAKIEFEYAANRKAILDVKRQHYSETQELLDACDAELLQTIRKQLTGTPGTKWAQYHSDRMASELKNRYGLGASAVAKFKSAYNKFAIEEYKILYAGKNIPQADKRSSLEKAGSNFCASVKPLFSAPKYTEWEGRWNYIYEQRLEKKLNK